MSSVFLLRLLLLVEKYPPSKFINIVPFSKLNKKLDTAFIIKIIGLGKEASVT